MPTDTKEDVMPRAAHKCFVALLILVAMLALSASSNAAAPSTDPHLCLNGGWQSLQKDNGGHFRNEQACLRYVEHGGVLYSPTLTIVPFCDLTQTQFEMSIFGFGFHPNSSLTLTIEGALWGNGTNVIGAVTDGETFFQGQPAISPATFVTVTARDAQGVTATASAHVLCPVR